ncbi:PREDICTED: putative uncharacterized protein DDB_G0291608 [Habropoda laboriosa]|uniref:putative uncharacterized protein DDB_G0291608 n=1 Tax=Habropoda laboriosa TaxID=597456 RepID=UPI00083CB646|nr:PREDICTED: putative uncharacterized protein DDB_G0291608 [Habropoda laboriosa]
MIQELELLLQLVITLKKILLIALISTAAAQEQKVHRATGAQQSQIKYQDPNGLKIDWKFFSPQNQWRSQLQNSQPPQQQEVVHRQQATLSRPPQSQLVQVDQEQIQQRSYLQPHAQPEAQSELDQVQYKSYVQPQVVEAPQDPNQPQYRGYPQPQAPVETHPDPNQVHYNRYNEPPAHVKQVLDNYKEQRPYVEQSPFGYSPNDAVPQQYEQQSPNAELPHYEQPSESFEHIEQQKSRREYPDRGTQGRIVYREEYEQLQQQLQQQQQQEAQEVGHIPVPIESLPVQPSPKLVLSKDMPRELQQLLQFQAQLPYDVIANSISYRPKKLFIPKLLSSDAKGPYNYRSKVYYVDNGRYDDASQPIKPVEEEQRHS